MASAASARTRAAEAVGIDVPKKTIDRPAAAMTTAAAASLLILLFIAFLKYNDLKDSLILIGIILAPLVIVFIKKQSFSIGLNMGEGLDCLINAKVKLNISDEGLSVSGVNYIDSSTSIIPWGLLEKTKTHNDILFIENQVSILPIIIPLRILRKDKELFLKVINDKLS